MGINDFERRLLDLRAEGYGTEKLAKALKRSRTTIRYHLARLSKRGYSPGFAPLKPVDGMTVARATVLTDADGTVKGQWTRWAPDAEAIEAAVAALESRVAGKAPRIAAPVHAARDLMLEIPIPDHHMGMLAWGAEAGEDYDCAIATKLLTTSVRLALAESPKVGKAVLIVLGDYYHADDRNGRTEKSGHVLDTDSRFEKRLDSGVNALCEAIELAATRAEQVEVVVISGNHDWHSAKWLPRIIKAYYRNNSRIAVNIDPSPRYYLTFGKVMLAYMHGDTMKAQQFARLIPAEATEAWGKTEFRYGRVGHWHHRSTEEYPGIVIETLPTLAARDAWANEHGYLSRRALTSYLWHAEYGLRAKMEIGTAEAMARAKA